MQISYFEIYSTGKWNYEAGYRNVIGIGEVESGNIANVVHCGRNWPPLFSCDTIQNIVCQNSRNECVLLYLLWYVIVVLCVLYNISNSFCSWSGSNRPSRSVRVNSCKSCHKNSLQFQKDSRIDTHMSFLLSPAPFPLNIWFLIWQSIDSSFGKHKHTLRNLWKNIDNHKKRDNQKISNNMAKTIWKHIFISMPRRLVFQCNIISTMYWMIWNEHYSMEEITI